MGQTTLAVNPATAAHLEGGPTLVVDMDRQASAFDWSAARLDGSSLDASPS
jgi:cellulose biosynthesis protein BcsQ